MKIVPVLLSVIALLFVGCGKPNPDNPDTPDNPNQIFEMTVGFDDLQRRGGYGEEVMYLPNSQTPYTGWVKDTYSNGQVLETVYVKDGKRQGLKTQWYENGQKQYETNYKDGKRHGLDTQWWDNGQKKFEINYKDDKLHGLWTQWHYDGQKSSETHYVDGVKVE